MKVSIHTLKQLPPTHLLRLAHFLSENLPLPQQSYKETRRLLKQLIKQLRKEIRSNVKGLNSVEIAIYHDSVFDFLSAFLDYDRLLFFEFISPPGTSGEHKILQRLRKQGLSLNLLEDANPVFRRKKLELCTRIISLFEEECLVSPRIWMEFPEDEEKVIKQLSE